MEPIRAYHPRFSSFKKMNRSGKNAYTTLQENRNLILELIYKHRSISRKQLADMTGLQLATITMIMKELLAQGIVKDSGRMDGGSGRTVKTFSIIDEMYVVSVRITAVYVKVALYDTKLKNHYVKKCFFTTDDTIPESRGIILDCIQEAEKRVGRDRIAGIAIGVEHRYCLTGDDYAIWDNKRGEYCCIGKEIHDLTQHLVFTNRAINYSTYHLNDSISDIIDLNYFHMLININISYELESAVIIDGEIIYGKNGKCGQLKDLRVNGNTQATYKDVLGVAGVLRRAQELVRDYPDSCISGLKTLNIRDVINGYKAQDPLCLQVYDEVCGHLGFIIATLIQWMDPDAVIVGDEIPTNERFLERLRACVSEYAGQERAARVSCINKERITENDPALIGAADFAFSKLFGQIGFTENL